MEEILTKGFDIPNIMGSIMTGIYIIIILGAIAFVLYWLYKKSQFKHTYIIKKITKEGTITVIDKLRIKRDKNTGMTRWSLEKLKRNVPIAPQEAVSITSKGKYIVQAYLTINDEFRYIEQDYNIGKHKAGEKPLLSNDKDFYSNEIKEGTEKYKQKKSISDIIVTVAPYMAIIIIFVLFMIFYQDMVKPMTQVSNNLNSGLKEFTETFDKMQNTCKIENKPNTELNTGKKPIEIPKNEIPD